MAVDELVDTGNVLGLGATETIDPKTNPFSPENLETPDTSEDEEENPFIIDEDEEIDLRESDTDDSEQEEDSDEDDTGETPDPLTPDPDLDDTSLEAIIERYKGDPKALAKAVREAQRKISQQGAELGTLRKKPVEQVAEQEQTPTTGELGFPVDEYGLEKVPASYFAGKFTRQVQDVFEQDPRTLEGYLMQVGYSQEDAREEAKHAFENDTVGRHAAAYAEEARQVYQQKYQEVRATRSGERATEEQKRIAEMGKAQVAICEQERKSRASDFEAIGASPERAKEITIDIHNKAIALVNADIKAGRLTILESHNSQIVPEYYDKALLALSKESGGLAKLIYRSEAQTPNSMVGVSGKTGGARADAQAKRAATGGDLGPEAKSFYETLKRSKPDLTVEQYRSRHGKTIDMSK